MAKISHGSQFNQFFSTYLPTYLPTYFMTYLATTFTTFLIDHSLPTMWRKAISHWCHVAASCDQQKKNADSDHSTASSDMPM
jgi:hypothetical protein